MSNLSSEKPAIAGGSPSGAWQPLTFGGVAAFAQASWGRLWLVELLAALWVACAGIWFLANGWAPAIQEAIRQLPDQGEIRSAQLHWGGETSRRLAATPFLAFNVVLEDTEEVPPVTDLQCTFTKTGIILRSMPGHLSIPYPSSYVVALNRTELEPWWGAWKPAILAGAGILMVAGLFLCWMILALGYAPAVRLIAWVLDRQISLPGSWRLGAAALIPGAILMSAGLVAYGLRQIDLIGLMVAFGLHWIVGWIYLVLSPAWLPSRSQTSEVTNPFVSNR